MGEVASARRWLVFATLLFGVCGMIGVLLPWAHGLQVPTSGGWGRSSVYGFMYVQGVVAFAGAAGLTVVSALRVSRRVGDIPYVALGTACCIASIVASIAFWRSEVGAVDPASEYYFYPVHISAGSGFFATIESSSAALLCLMAFAFDAAGFRVVHDDRSRAGGALVPSYLRFRIDREGTHGSSTPTA